MNPAQELKQVEADYCEMIDLGITLSNMNATMSKTTIANLYKRAHWLENRIDYLKNKFKSLLI
jgi:hypothetical protein